VSGRAPPPLSIADFFAGVRAGRVQVQRCTACGEHAVPPKAFCPSCGAARWESVALAGDGEVASFTVIRVPPRALAAEAPYPIAVVRMTEGVSLTGRLSGVPLEGIRVGLPVRLVPPAQPAADPPVITFQARSPARPA
jgi:uncharacterized OB-fold protein